jgi:TatD DNase family protein
LEFDFADAHCHLDSIIFSYDKKINEKILYITSGYSESSNEKNMEISQKYPNVFFTAGISPQEANKYENIEQKIMEWEEELFKMAKNKKLVAIGEIGLDYHFGKTEEERSRQLDCFYFQLHLAEKLSLPVVIHSRDAEKECIEILENFSLNYMLHYFSGKAEMARKAEEGKGFLSIPPIKSKERKKIIGQISLDKILCESDAPAAGKMPEDTIESIKMVAEIKKIELEETKKQILKNTISFFRLNL